MRVERERYAVADVSVDTVSCLLSEQFPPWANLDIRPVESDGWDNTTFD